MILKDEKETQMYGLVPKFNSYRLKDKGQYCQNYLKTSPIESKVGYSAKLVYLWYFSNCLILQLTYMSTCCSNPKHSFSTICEIITFKVEEEKILVPKGDINVLEVKKTIFSSRCRMNTFIFLFLGEFYTTRGVEA